MKIKNINRQTLTIYGVDIPGGEIRDVPGLTLPEIMATELRTKVIIVKANTSSPKSSPKEAVKEKVEVSTKEEKKLKTLVKLEDEPEVEPKVVGELTEEGEVIIFNEPKSVKENTN